MIRKNDVEYKSGESRYGFGAVDYMYCLVEEGGKGIELYAEVKNETWNSELESYDDERATFDTLKAEIIRQALEAGINTDGLVFFE